MRKVIDPSLIYRLGPAKGERDSVRDHRNSQRTEVRRYLGSDGFRNDFAECQAV